MDRSNRPRGPEPLRCRVVNAPFGFRVPIWPPGCSASEFGRDRTCHNIAARSALGVDRSVDLEKDECGD